MNNKKIRNLPLLTLVVLAAPAWSQEAKPTTEQVIVPQVERREVKPPQYPSRDFAVGLFAGSYSTENFGAAAVGGLRFSYHITEDIFVDAAIGQSKVSDENYRQILPGGIFANGSEKLSYYSVSAGYNVLPGEVFIGRGNALATQGYLLAGIGSTRFAGQRHQTLHAGFGMRVLMKQRFALQADVRDHVFSLDLLGKRQSTQNLEVTAGLTFFF
jgi:outer membrane beta-barrel protein